MTPKQYAIWNDYMEKIAVFDWATVAGELGDTSQEAKDALAERTRLVDELIKIMEGS